MNLGEIRKDFPILDGGIIYLDNAATSLTPEPVVDAAMSYYREYNARPYGKKALVIPEVKTQRSN